MMSTWHSHYAKSSTRAAAHLDVRLAYDRDVELKFALRPWIKGTHQDGGRRLQLDPRIPAELGSGRAPKRYTQLRTIAAAGVISAAGQSRIEITVGRRSDREPDLLESS